MMTGPENGNRASIPEITIRHAAGDSPDISLNLLQGGGQIIDELTKKELALEVES